MRALRRDRDLKAKRSGRRRRRPLVIIAPVAVELLGLWLRTHRVGGNVIVRCREGHLFTTVWVPGASVKSIRLGWWRFQRCPVGDHWAIVTPVRESSLTDEELALATARRDIRVP